MKIGVDATSLARRHKTGVDYFTLELVRHAAAHLPSDSIELGYFGSKELDLGIKATNVVKRPTSFPRLAYQALLRYLRAPAFDRLTKIKADVFFFPNFVCFPLSHKVPQIVLVHDLSYLDTPQYFTPRLIHYLTRFVPQSIAASAKVVVNSDFTKTRLVEEYKIDPKKVVIIHPGIDTSIFKPASDSEITRVKDIYGIDSEYILFTGTLTDRKNVSGLMKAYQQLPPEIRNQYKLVLAGGHLSAQIEDPDIKVIYDELAAEGNVIRTGYASQTDLVALYSSAAVFVYPSRYEGFGMPILEAMACGTPVITSTTSALPEAGGDGATYIDPESSEGIADAIKLVLTDEKTRDQAITNGHKHVKSFSWDDSGKQLAELFKEIAS
jgi:glycosyltransferase involved in cell wall biosynthesis